MWESERMEFKEWTELGAHLVVLEKKPQKHTKNKNKIKNLTYLTDNVDIFVCVYDYLTYFLRVCKCVC